MYTNNEQTAKLIELGFEKPTMKNIPTSEGVVNEEWYSIGELIEMLPNVVESEDSEYATLQMYFDLFNWVIEYTGVEKTEYATSAIELIDALYEMIVKLKEKWEKQEVELTMQQIADKFGIDVNQLKIKK
jgi:hypothetical protein